MKPPNLGNASTEFMGFLHCHLRFEDEHLEIQGKWQAATRQMVSSNLGNLRNGYTKEIKKYTPLKINMEHNHGGLEDHVPFKMGDL